MIYCEDHVIVTYFDGYKKQITSYNLNDIALHGSVDRLLHLLRSLGYTIISIDFNTID